MIDEQDYVFDKLAGRLEEIWFVEADTGPYAKPAGTNIQVAFLARYENFEEWKTRKEQEC